jgi:hypothetical protein
MMKRAVQKTVKAFDGDIALINARAKHLGCSAAEVIHDLCDQLRKDLYLQDVRETFELVRENPQLLAEFEAEQKAWECTLSDGLENAT